MKKILLSIVLAIICSNTFANTLPTKEKAKDLAKNVMTEISKGNMEGGVELTQPYLVVPNHEFMALLDQMKMQQPVINQRFGKTLSVEVATIEYVGESLMLVLYLQKFENHVLRWKFYFYKPKDGWVLNTFTFDDKIQSMFRNQ